MATQTATARDLAPWVPFRAARVRLARALAYRRALRLLTRSGYHGPIARLLAREIAERVRC